MIEQLKVEVEKVFGQKIQKRAQSELLAMELFTKTNILVSYNTFRRLFGIIAYRVPRVSTLDALSRYVGYASFLDFSNRYHTVDEWPLWENLFLAIDNRNIQELLDMFKFRLSQKNDFFHSFSVLLRELIYRKDLSSLRIILAQEEWSIVNLPYEDALKIGVVVGRQFRNVHDEEFEKSLLSIPLFRDLILKMFVDYSGLNKKYGEWVSYVNQLKGVDNESLIFTSGVLIWRDLLNGKEANLSHLARIPDLTTDMHPILYGRVASLNYHFEKKHEQRQVLLQTWMNLILLHPKRTLEYLFIANVHCLVFPIKELSQFLVSFDKYTSKTHFWYNLSQLNVYYLSLVQHALFTGETAMAATILEKIDLRYLRYGYDEFLLLFVYLFQHELCLDLSQKKELWQRLLDHSAYLNYAIFTEEYFRGYFVS